MSLKLTAASFLTGVKQSGLIPADKLNRLLDECQSNGVNLADSAAIAAAFVQRGALTDWQSEKLLQGRHKGFLLGRYRLLALLGTGEMSAVYLAEHVTMERRCAIKVLPAAKVKDTSYLGRFLREAKAVATLNHPNIVKAYDVDQQSEGGTEIHFLVMEYVDGRNLGKIVEQQGPLGYIEAADYIRQAADGLHHAHDHGLVHRDVKPENLLIDSQGKVHLLDLGLARFFKSEEEESLTIKHDEKVLGTADYLAPEQAIDSHNVDHRVDIYSLGCTFYYSLTGHPPFTDGSLVQRLLAHQTRQPPSVRFDRADVPDDLLEILERMMAKKADDRFQSAEEVSRALSLWLIRHASDDWRHNNLSLVATHTRGTSSLAAVGHRPENRESDSVAQPPATSKRSSAPKVSDSMPMVTLAPRLRSVPTPVPVEPPAAASASATKEPAPRKPTPTTAARKSVAKATPRDWERTILVAVMAAVLFTAIGVGVWLVNAQQPETLKASTTPDSAEVISE
ncbi:protein kinase [bacterium]|nr:protein kinase [bacterium]